MIFQFVLAANFFFLGSAFTVKDCPPEVSRDGYLHVFQDKCYEFELFRLKNYKEAVDYCKEDGGSLAIITSKAVDDFIFNTSKHILSSIYHTPEAYYLWLGMRRSDKDAIENRFVWNNGSKLGYDHFRNYGDNGDQNCAAMDTNIGDWVMMSCEDDDDYYYLGERFVCQYSVIEDSSTSEEKDDKTKFPASITIDDCPLGFSDRRILQVLGNTCYMFFTYNRYTYDESQAYCRRYGGGLVTVKSNKTNEFLQHHLYITHRFHFKSDPVWIGLRYNGTSQGYRWSDGTKPDKFTNYKSNVFYDKCFAMSPTDGKWVESDCGDNSEGGVDDKKYFICEFPPYPGTEELEKTTVMTKTSTASSSSSTPLPTTTMTNSSPPPTTTTLPPPPPTTPLPTTSTTPEPILPVEPPMIPSTTTTPTTTTIPTPTTPTPTTTTTAPTTAIPTPITTTTAPTTTTTTPTTTTTAPTAKPTCKSIICELDCGLDGYFVNPETGCTVCKCT